METKPTFVPMLAIGSGVTDISFYTHAFNAVELRRWRNDDGTIHVAELSINGALFHLHEDKPEAGVVNPAANNVTSVTIGLIIDDPDVVVSAAVKAGARVLLPMQNYDYGYRQGKIIDPFGHQWLIEKKI